MLDLRPGSDIADYFILCNGNSDRQLRALSDAVREAIKTQYGKLPVSVEGESSSGWILMDYGDVVVHIMTEQQRDYYDLEGLWKNAQVLVSIQ